MTEDSHSINHGIFTVSVEDAFNATKIVKITFIRALVAGDNFLFGINSGAIKDIAGNLNTHVITFRAIVDN